MQKTPIQQLIDYAIEKFPVTDDKVMVLMIKATELLETEKKVIQDAFNSGYINGEDGLIDEIYYNKTFNNKTMKENTIIYELAVALKKILDNHYLSFIPIKEIPEILREDFYNYNIGNTMSMVDSEECAPYRDIKNWINKIISNGGLKAIIK